MQIKNIVIFNSTADVDGAWIDISNLVALSVQITGLESDTWIEVSNDPNVNFDGPNGQISPPSAPTLSQGPAAFGGLTGQGTYYVKTTYITKNGETLASSESSLAVSDGNVLQIAPPPADTKGLAIGWNVYVGKSSGAEVLQSTPPYTPAWVVDATPGIHYAISGVIPLNQSYYLPNGISTSGTSVPGSDTSGGINSGLNITGDLSTGIAPSGNDEIAIFYSNPGATSTSAMVCPSCLCWKWLRVRKSTGATRLTTAFLMGQNG